ncbi:hypothetical protein, partial [Muricomes intestini]|uniref:hypothetical protein n=1 Tax=Muricomes intestini TaxID=1796634 RepID=UPI002FE0F094
TKGEIVTIRRSVKNASRSNKLLTVYYCKISSIYSKSIKSEDMYIHDPGSAVSGKGFHKFLEEFIGWELPIVPTYDGIDRKLYIQTIFSAFFIEQKRGWSDIMATLPTKFKIKDASKRVIEFILELDVFNNERKKLECNFSYNCTVHNLPISPEILKDNFIETLIIMKKVSDGDEITLTQYIERCKRDIANLEKPGIVTVGSQTSELEIELLH